MAVDSVARALGANSCSKIIVNGTEYVENDRTITLPNYPNEGGGAFYTAGEHINIDGSNIISATYTKATVLEDGLMSKEDKLDFNAINLGYMDKSVYDPTTKSADSFDMTNMSEGTTNKIFTSTERTKLNGIEDNANNYSLPTSSNLIKGGIKVNGTNTNVVSEVLTINNATTVLSGLESSTDKAKLDGIVGSVSSTPNTYVIRDTDADTQVNGIDFDLTPTTTTISDGHVQWNADEVTLSIGTKEGSTLEVGQELVFPLINGTQENINDGTVVSWFDSLGTSGKLLIQKFIADGSINAEKCLGIVTNQISPNEVGHATWFGKLRGVDTTGTPYGEIWEEGDSIWASATIAGGMTNVKPTYPNLVIRLGTLITKHQQMGTIGVRPIIHDFAEDINVKDVGNYYTSSNTESTFQELGNKLSNLFDDLPPVPLITAKTGTNIPTLSVFNGNIMQYTFAVNDEVYGTSEITHLYKNGTDLHPHIHWVSNGINTTNRYVKWELEYSYASMNGVFSTPTIISHEEVIPLNTTSKTQFISNFPIIVGTNVEVGGYLCWRLRRITSDGIAPTSNPFGLAFGIHVEQSVLK